MSLVGGGIVIAIILLLFFLFFIGFWCVLCAWVIHRDRFERMRSRIFRRRRGAAPPNVEQEEPDGEKGEPRLSTMDRNSATDELQFNSIQLKIEDMSHNLSSNNVTDEEATGSYELTAKSGSIFPQTDVLNTENTRQPDGNNQAKIIKNENRDPPIKSVQFKNHHSDQIESKIYNHNGEKESVKIINRDSSSIEFESVKLINPNNDGIVVQSIPNQPIPEMFAPQSPKTTTTTRFNPTPVDVITVVEEETTAAEIAVSNAQTYNTSSLQTYPSSTDQEGGFSQSKKSPKPSPRNHRRIDNDAQNAVLPADALPDSDAGNLIAPSLLAISDLLTLTETSSVPQIPDRIHLLKHNDVTRSFRPAYRVNPSDGVIKILVNGQES